MSLTPTTPAFSTKSFWKKPEGNLGLVVVILLAGFLLYNGLDILNWAIAFVTDVLHLMYLAAIVIVILALISDRTFRNLIKNLFQSTMRFFTSLFVTLDPIGILKNTIKQMVANKEKLDDSVSQCSASRREVKTRMDSNDNLIHQAKSKKDQADKAVAQTSSLGDKQKFAFQSSLQAQEMTRRIHSNEKLQVIFDQASKLYDMLTRYQNLADYNIQNITLDVANAEEERKSILIAYKGMSLAKRIIKGDPEQVALFNQSLDYLVDDNARKLGEMEDFTRYSEKFLTSMDLDQGASVDDAEKMLASYEKKLLVSDSQKQTVPNFVTTAQAVPVSNSTKAIDADYLKDYK